ncbi:MAG: methyltransferase domain-containing protein [Candidatus Methylomirabilales bacterium]
MKAAALARRLNWACGPRGAPGWFNSDRRAGEGIQHTGDILDGLPLAPDSLDYAVTIHGLQDLAVPDVLPALRELHRVLRPGGVLRLAVPDLDRAIRAYREQDHAYFYIRDEEAETIGGKFSYQMTWYGSVRALFTFDFLEELLRKAGFHEVRRCGYRETAGPYPEIVGLDNRPRESLFVEAVK